MDLDVNLLIVAAAGDNHIAARVIDDQAASGGEVLRESLIALVLVSPELIHVVRIQMEGPAKSAAVEATEGETKKSDQKQQREDSAAEVAPPELRLVGVKVPNLYAYDSATLYGPRAQYSRSGEPCTRRPS